MVVGMCSATADLRGGAKLQFPNQVPHWHSRFAVSLFARAEQAANLGHSK